MQYFAARVRECRKQAGLNQKDFGALGGVAIGAQQRYEAGTSDPDASYFQRLYAAGIDIFWLITGERAITSMSDQDRRLLLACRPLSARFVASVIEMLEAASPVDVTPDTSPADRAEAPETLHDRRMEFKPK